MDNNINNQEYHKINGFTRNPHLLQILSYIFFLSSFIVFTLFMLPTYDQTLQFLSCFLFYASWIGVLIFGFICTISDPTDDVVILEKNTRAKGILFDSSQYEYYCNNCNTHVSSLSKHCKQCDRCVNNFDHHCKWLNNCIGAKNYKYFSLLILFVMINSGSFAIFSIISIFLISQDNQNEKISKQLYFEIKENQVQDIEIVLWIYFVIFIILFILDTNLVFFHIWLRMNNLTTYDYILKKRNQQLLPLQTDINNEQNIQKDKGQKRPSSPHPKYQYYTLCGSIKQFIENRKKSIKIQQLKVNDTDQKLTSHFSENKIQNQQQINLKNDNFQDEREGLMDKLMEQANCHSVDLENEDNITQVDKAEKPILQDNDLIFQDLKLNSKIGQSKNVMNKLYKSVVQHQPETYEELKINDQQQVSKSFFQFQFQQSESNEKIQEQQKRQQQINIIQKQH